MFFDHSFDLAGYRGRTDRAAPFPQSPGADAPTLFGQLLYPAPDRRPADTKLTDGIIDATFQTASPIEICLDKRAQHGSPARLFSTNHNAAFTTIFHR